MKKILLVVSVLILALSNAEAKKKPVQIPPVPVAPQIVLTNDVDSMSYALGINIGSDFANNLKGIPGGKSNIDLLIKGFSQALKEDSTILTKEVAQTYFRDYITKAQTKENDLKKAEAENFLAENKLKEGVQTTPSGLQYLILTPSEGEKPQPTDTVKVHYTGTLMDGKVFDSSVERGEPIEFPLNGVIPGWTEGLQLMSVGSKYKFYIPYQLAYGERGAGGVVPPYSPLVFEVELLGIKKFVPAPKVEEVKTPAKTTTKKVSTTKKK